MAKSLYETCRDLVEAYRLQDSLKMNQIVQEMALFFPTPTVESKQSGETRVIQPYNYPVYSNLPCPGTAGRLVTCTDEKIWCDTGIEWREATPKEIEIYRRLQGNF